MLLRPAHDGIGGGLLRALLKKTRRRHGIPICDDDAIVVSLGSN